MTTLLAECQVVTAEGGPPKTLFRNGRDKDTKRLERRGRGGDAEGGDYPVCIWGTLCRGPAGLRIIGKWLQRQEGER